MQTFKEWTNEYNNLFKRRILVEQELKNSQTNLIKELLEKEYKDIENKIDEFEKMKLYTEAEYKRAGEVW